MNQAFVDSFIKTSSIFTQPSVIRHAPLYLGALGGTLGAGSYLYTHPKTDKKNVAIAAALGAIPGIALGGMGRADYLGTLAQEYAAKVNKFGIDAAYAKADLYKSKESLRNALNTAKAKRDSITKLREEFANIKHVDEERFPGVTESFYGKRNSHKVSPNEVERPPSLAEKIGSWKEWLPASAGATGGAILGGVAGNYIERDSSMLDRIQGTLSGALSGAFGGSVAPDIARIAIGIKKEIKNSIPLYRKARRETFWGLHNADRARQAKSAVNEMHRDLDDEMSSLKDEMFKWESHKNTHKMNMSRAHGDYEQKLRDRMHRWRTQSAKPIAPTLLSEHITRNPHDEPTAVKLFRRA